MRGLLEDELQYYGLLKDDKKPAEEKKEEGKEDRKEEKKDATATEFVPIDLERIKTDFTADREFYNSDENTYMSYKSLPIFRVCQTLMQLAEVFAFKLKTDEAIKLYDYVQKIASQILQTDETMFASFVI